ncbi:MAG: hypothetical protein AAF416_22945 [Pseudomonadota bacterium]
MKIAALFTWLLIPLGLWLAVTLWGTPHLVWSYRFYDNGDPHNPRAPRHYINCTYLGWAGAITVPADRGHCPWIRFLDREPG